MGVRSWIAATTSRKPNLDFRFRAQGVSKGWRVAHLVVKASLGVNAVNRLERARRIIITSGIAKIREGVKVQQSNASGVSEWSQLPLTKLPNPRGALTLPDWLKSPCLSSKVGTTERKVPGQLFVAEIQDRRKRIIACQTS
jgi:hypothetical protein